MIFYSRKYASLRVVVDPKATMVVGGQKITQGMSGTPAGLSAQFQNGVYETNDEEMITALKEHPSFGKSFFTKDQGLTDEGKAEIAEKKAVSEEAGSICPKCGNKYKNRMALTAHMKVHKND